MDMCCVALLWCVAALCLYYAVMILGSGGGVLCRAAGLIAGVWLLFVCGPLPLILLPRRHDITEASRTANIVFS